MKDGRPDLSKEAREEISKKLKGHSVSRDTREKISKKLLAHHANRTTPVVSWCKGKKLSKETKRKMSKARKGRKHWWGYKAGESLKKRWEEDKELRERSSETMKRIIKEKYPTGRTGELAPNWQGGLTEKRKSKILKRGSKELSRKLSEAMTGREVSKETRKKLSELHKGEKNHFWKGGITPEHLKIRGSLEHRLWRESVFERDNWTCQRCSRRSKKGDKVCLHPHHIKNFAKYPGLRFAIDNGITFCEDCHKEFHKIYGTENNTREQVEEFLNKKEE